MSQKLHYTLVQQTPKVGNMKKILVPFDFSEQATDAFRFALQMAKQSKSQVHLLHVVELPVLHDTVLMPTLSFEEENLKDMQKNAGLKLERLIKRHSTSEVRVETKVEFGSTSVTILDYIDKNEIDQVVMGTKGATGMKEILIGSNTEKIVRACHVPVIAVKKFSNPRQIRNIVFPNTLETDSNEDLVTKVKALQQSLNATLHIVWINTPFNFKQDLETREDLNRFAKRHLMKDYTLSIFNDMDEETGIINFTHSIHADIIALGTHGRKGLAHILVGSLAENLVNHADRPVWTYTIKKER